MEEMFSVVKPLRIHFLCLLGTLTLVIGAARESFPAQQPAAPQLTQNVDPKARQMLDRTIQGLGGQAFLSAKSLTTKGRVFFFQDGNTAGMQPYESWVVFPDKRRFSYGKTKPVILINNGDKGWELDRYGLICSTRPATPRLDHLQPLQFRESAAPTHQRPRRPDPNREG